MSPRGRCASQAGHAGRLERRGIGADRHTPPWPCPSGLRLGTWRWRCRTRSEGWRHAEEPGQVAPTDERNRGMNQCNAAVVRRYIVRMEEIEHVQGCTSIGMNGTTAATGGERITKGMTPARPTAFTRGGTVAHSEGATSGVCALFVFVWVSGGVGGGDRASAELANEAACRVLPRNVSLISSLLPSTCASIKGRSKRSYSDRVLTVCTSARYWHQVHTGPVI